MLKILYVDQNEDYQLDFTKMLVKAGFNVDIVADPIKGLELLSKEKYSIILSELEFESIGGLRFLDSVANINPETKRVVLTCNDEPNFEIEAIKLGIDLFLLKSRGERLALDSIERLKKDIRVKTEADNYLVGVGCGLKMNLINHIVTIKGEPVHLTPKEFEILQLLLENKGKFLSRDLIIKTVWHDSVDKEVRIVDTHIKKIREKTGCFEITTVRGYGYMWRD